MRFYLLCISLLIATCLYCPNVTLAANINKQTTEFQQFTNYASLNPLEPIQKTKKKKTKKKKPKKQHYNEEKLFFIIAIVGFFSLLLSLTFLGIGLFNGILWAWITGASILGATFLASLIAIFGEFIDEGILFFAYLVPSFWLHSLLVFIAGAAVLGLWWIWVPALVLSLVFLGLLIWAVYLFFIRDSR